MKFYFLSLYIEQDSQNQLQARCNRYLLKNAISLSGGINPLIFPCGGEYRLSIHEGNDSGKHDYRS
jgi:hypothetical protein